MNIPNQLTVLRVILIPVFVLFLLVDFNIHAFLIWTRNENRTIYSWYYIYFSFTEFDGYLARKWELVTNMGKF